MKKYSAHSSKEKKQKEKINNELDQADLAGIKSSCENAKRNTENKGKKLEFLRKSPFSFPILDAVHARKTILKINN